MSSVPQFSLKRLLIGTTVFCLALGLIVAFPREALKLSLAIPFLVATGVWTYYSGSRSATLAACGVSALVALALWPTLSPSYSQPPSRLAIYGLDFLNNAVPGGIGAAVGGFVSLFFTGVRD